MIYPVRIEIFHVLALMAAFIGFLSELGPLRETVVLTAFSVRLIFSLLAPVVQRVDSVIPNL